MGQRLGARSRAATSVSGPASRVHPFGKQVRLVGREFEETRNKERTIERVGEREKVEVADEESKEYTRSERMQRL